jgi:hypothetical protein
MNIDQIGFREFIRVKRQNEKESQDSIKATGKASNIQFHVTGGKAVNQSDLRSSAHRRLKQHINKAISQQTQTFTAVPTFSSFDTIALGKQFFQNETFADRIMQQNAFNQAKSRNASDAFGRDARTEERFVGPQHGHSLTMKQPLALSSKVNITKLT